MKETLRHELEEARREIERLRSERDEWREKFFEAIGETTAAEDAKNFLADLPTLTTTNSYLKSKIDTAFFLLMSTPKIWLSLEDLPHEIWRDVLNYESLYQISNFGRVKSFHGGKEKILQANLTKRGYFRACLNKAGESKTVSVHILVAQAFVQNLYGKPFVHHLNNNKADNRSDNLMWATHSENIRYAYEAGLLKSGANAHNAIFSETDAKAIRDYYIPRDKNFGAKALAKIFDTNINVILNVVNGKTYKNV